MKPRHLILLLQVFITFACQKDPDSPEATAHAETQLVYGPATREGALALYQEEYLTSHYSTMNWNGSTTSCTPGTLDAEALAAFMRRINYFRRAAGLTTMVTNDPSLNPGCQQAALMMLANNALDHTPPTTWKCYTQAGANAAGKSNLHKGVVGTAAIDGYILDFGASNIAAGHRRWILYSRANAMGVGATAYTNALDVISNRKNTLPEGTPELVAWPPAGYLPVTLTPGRWSASFPYGTPYGAQVKVTNAEGQQMPITVHPVQSSYGDITIVWDMQGLSLKAGQDHTFTVTITGAKKGTETKDYTYTVTLFDPNLVQ